MKNPLRTDVQYRINARTGAQLRGRAILWDVISTIPAVSDFTAFLSWIDFRAQFRKHKVTYHLISPKSPGKSIFLFALELIPVASIYWGITKRVEGAIQESREEDEKNAEEEKKKAIRRMRYEERYKSETEGDDAELPQQNSGGNDRPSWDNRYQLYGKN